MLISTESPEGVPSTTKRIFPPFGRDLKTLSLNVTMRPKYDGFAEEVRTLVVGTLLTVRIAALDMAGGVHGPLTTTPNEATPLVTRDTIKELLRGPPAILVAVFRPCNEREVPASVPGKLT